MSDVGEAAAGALEWMAAQARDTGDGGIGWPEWPTSPAVEDCLYAGTPGIVVCLLDAHAATGEQRCAELAIRGARHLAAVIDAVPDSGLYVGLTGYAFALASVGKELDDAPAAEAARRATRVVAERFDGERWNPYTELINGHAGVALGALACDDLELATTACDALRRLARHTEQGVDWDVGLGGHSVHHMSHGTIGIAYALAAVGAATNRPDLIELALAATRQVLSLADRADGGFRLAHSDPPMPGSDRYPLGWCHGPTGDAQLFRLLSSFDQAAEWGDLVDRCWHTVTTSGLPARLRPGFWDNNGRCCGTAGVLALALDLQDDGRTDLTFATTLVQDLLARATIDAGGVRWSNLEHRQAPSVLEPHTGWGHGNAGIIRELLRYDAASEGRPSTYRVPWPDQFASRHLRTQRESP